MRKSLLPLVASLALCGTATAALIATNARAAQTVHRPMMITQAAPSDGAGSRAEDAMMEDGARGARMCKDMAARKTGELAYLEAKLALTPEQAPLYGRWKQVMLDIAQKHEADCGARFAHRPAERPTLMDGMAMEEKKLKARLSDLEAERPTLSALYAALSPEQKMELGHAARHQMQGRMHRMMGMMDRPHRGMGPGHMERGPMGEAPPPPPAQ